jgi:hypothetical protein
VSINSSKYFGHLIEIQNLQILTLLQRVLKISEHHETHPDAIEFRLKAAALVSKNETIRTAVFRWVIAQMCFHDDSCCVVLMIFDVGVTESFRSGHRPVPMGPQSVNFSLTVATARVCSSASDSSPITLQRICTLFSSAHSCLSQKNMT